MAGFISAEGLLLSGGVFFLAEGPLFSGGVFVEVFFAAQPRAPLAVSRPMNAENKRAKAKCFGCDRLGWVV